MLRQLIRRHRVSLAVVTVLAGIGGGVCVKLLAVINELAAAGLAGGAWDPVLAGLLWLAALLAVGTLSQVLLARLGANLVAELRLDLSMRFLALDYERLAQRKHLVFGALIEDVGRMGPLVLLAPQLAYNALLIVLCSGYLITLSPPLFAVLAACHGLTLVVGWAMERHTRARFDAMRRGEEQVFGHFRTLSEGKKELTLSTHRAAHFAETLLRPAIATTRDLMGRLHLAWGLTDTAATALSYGSVFGVVVIGHAVIGAPATTIVQVVISGLFLAGPIGFLVHARPQVARGAAGLRHLQQVGLDLEAPWTPAPRRTDAPSDWRCLRASGLCYQYPEEAPGDARRGVGPIELELHRGETLFITGGNGSGKSTLVLLLCALLRPAAGTLELDGQPVWPDVEGYRNRWAAVFGDYFLFEHVLDGQGGLVPDARIDAQLQRLGLHPRVRAQHGALSDLALSTGQRKRLALLQCEAADRDIVVLDEWAADQDPQFREHFYCEVLPGLKRRGKTLLVISHDDRYFHVADRVLTLEDGRVRAVAVRPVAAARAVDAAPGGLVSAMAGLQRHGA